MKYGERADFSYIKYTDIGCLQAEVEYPNFNANHQNFSTMGSLLIYLAYSGGDGVPSVGKRRINICSDQHPACTSVSAS